MSQLFDFLTLLVTGSILLAHQLQFPFKMIINRLKNGRWFIPFKNFRRLRIKLVHIQNIYFPSLSKQSMYDTTKINPSNMISTQVLALFLNLDIQSR